MARIVSLDKFAARTLKAFLENQRAAYLETMQGEDQDIARCQATYETTCMTMVTLLKFVCDLESENPVFPEPIAQAWEKLHDAVCEHGDNVLRSKGHKPEEF